MTTDKQTLEDVLDICLDRLQRGDSVQACLADYPEFADELEPLLQTAEMLQPRAVVLPIMSTKAYHRNSARLLERAAELRNSEARLGAGQSTGIVGALVAFFLGPSRRLALTAIAIIMLLVVVGTGTVAASNDSLPGSTLYPVKRTAETVWAAFPRSAEAQTQVHLQLAERRLQETEQLVAQGRINAGVVADMERELRGARTSANVAGDDALRTVLAQTEEYTRELNRLRAEAPADAREQVQQLLTTTVRVRVQVLEDLGDDAPSDEGPTPGNSGDAPGKAVTPKPTKTPKAAVDSDKEMPIELPTDRGQQRRGTPTPRAEEPGQAPDTPPGQDTRQGPPDEPPPASGPPDDAGPPSDAGPPDDAGPPPDAGPPDDAGPPEDSGKPENPGGGNDSNGGNNNNNNNNNNDNSSNKDKDNKGKNK